MFIIKSRVEEKYLSKYFSSIVDSGHLNMQAVKEA